MKIYQRMTQLLALSLSVSLLWETPIPAQPSLITQIPRVQTNQAILPELSKARVIYLGETHDNLADHQAQLQIIQALYQPHRKIAIALEMFQRPFQGVINDYLAGKLNEKELITQSEYEKRWGFPWEYYAPILRFAKDKQLPVLALNTPSEITRKVARQGLESLTPEEKKAIPPLSEIRTDNPQYRQMLLKIFEQHQHGGQGKSKGFDHFFLAQVLWDETMAETIANFLKTHPDYQVIVLAGRGHIVYGYGIPSRVQRRFGTEKIISRSVLFPSPDDTTLDQQNIADFFWNF